MNSTASDQARRDVIITIGQLAIGGAEMRLVLLAEEIAKRDLPWAITIYVVSGKPGELDARASAAGVEIVYGRRGLAGLPGLFRLCRRKRPAVLHVNAGSAAGFYALMGMMAGVRRRIAHLRDMVGPQGPRPHLRRRAYEILTNLTCTEIVGVSEGARRNRIVWRPWRRILNGIAWPEEGIYPLVRGPPGKPPRIVGLGRFDRVKNLHRAIAVFAAFRQRVPDAVLELIGPEGAESQADLIDTAKRLSVVGSIRFPGPTDDPFAALAGASALLLTSFSEGMPGVVLEALACGVPVVASDLPSTREIAELVPGTSLVPLANDDAQWAHALVVAMAADRMAIREAMRIGPFRAQMHTDAMIALWNGGIDG